MLKKFWTEPTKRFMLFIVIGVLFSTIAYTSVTYNLDVNGELSLGKQNGVVITNISTSSVSENCSYTINHYVNTLLTNTINVTENGEVVLRVEVKNTDNVKYRFDGILYDTNPNNELGTYSNEFIVPSITTGENGISTGTVINEQETKVIYVKYDYTGSSLVSPESVEQLIGTIKLNFKRLYNITYVLNGGTQNPNQVEYYAAGDSVTLLDPTKANATFIGWYENENHTGDAVTNINGRTADITLYAYFYTYYDIYFQIPSSWYKNNEDPDYVVKMYLYKDSDKSYHEAWPGISMSRDTSSSHDIYKVTLGDNIMENYDKVVFSNGNVPEGSGNTYYNIDKTYSQTVDIDFTSSNWGKIFAPEIYNNPDNANEVRFFARNNQGLYYYIWNNSSQTAKDPWPGLQISNYRGASVLDFVFDKSVYDRLIINKGSRGAQTPDMNIPLYSDLTFSCTTEGNNTFYFYVTRMFYDGSWYNINNWETTGYNTWNNNNGPGFANTVSDVDYYNSILG